MDESIQGIGTTLASMDPTLSPYDPGAGIGGPTYAGPVVFAPTDLGYATSTGDPIITSGNIGSTINALSNLSASLEGHGQYYGTSGGLSSAGTTASPVIAPAGQFQLPALNAASITPWLFLLVILWVAITVLKKV